MSVITEKLGKLQENIEKHHNVGVAFSGGIDSTFLLHYAIETLGGNNVYVYSCVSDVNAASGIANMRRVFSEHFKEETTLREIELFPFTWEEFIVNNEKRCYFCKKRMYSTLLQEIKKDSCSVLADGTNVDDLKGNRPGLKAIRELGVKTPLVDSGFTKQEIRKVAKDIGLINHDLPSNSCLATRIREGSLITKDTLEIIETAESYLHNLGFTGCRVKVNGKNAVIELQNKDLERCVNSKLRNSIIKTFQDLGLQEVCLCLTGR